MVARSLALSAKGAQDNLQRATTLVRHMITRYGMSEALGLETFEASR
jgi:cell division protease FtsH